MCADSIDGLAAEAKCVYVASPDKEYSKELWAPELHILDGKCCIYIACDGGDYYLTYSGAGCWCEHYCIAVMKLVGNNPLDKNCWQKRSLPVLTSNEVVKGAGHCSVVQDKKGINVLFHAWDKDAQQLKLNEVNVWHAILKINGDSITIE